MPEKCRKGKLGGQNPNLLECSVYKHHHLGFLINIPSCTWTVTTQSKMEKLLQWSIAQQTGDKEAMERIGAPDPEMLKQLFGGSGPDEPTLMRQAIYVAKNVDAEDEHKLGALENFEMLIENLDNANIIQNLKLWPDIIELLSSPNKEISVLAASIIATATQNNPPSQEAFLSHHSGLIKLISLASTRETPSELRLKSIFALASLIRNFEDGCQLFIKNDGLSCIDISTQVKDVKLVLRQLSLVGALLSTGLDPSKTAKFRESNLTRFLVSILSVDGNTTLIDKALYLMLDLRQLEYNFTEEEKKEIHTRINALEPVREQLSEGILDSVKSAFV